MDQHTAQRLLDLNRQFYETVADPFDATRQGWTPGLLSILPYFKAESKENPVSVLDAGCGNGRFARLLEEETIPATYVGVDGNADLLALANQATADLSHVRAHFYQADLADPDWHAPLADRRFDIVLCTATIQHLPGYDLRLRLLRDFRHLGRRWVILSFWQFLTSARFVDKLIDWSEISLSAADVEPGDALLPWKQGVEAVRYVHQVDEEELRSLAADAGLTIYDSFRADGKEGNLNLYAILKIAAG